jgi:hypothetical protein
VKIISVEAPAALVAVAPAPIAAAFAPAPRAAAAGRDEEANRLPRGERWKRRLPKVLW